MTKEHRGTIYVLISAILYSLGGLMIKLLPLEGLLLNAGRSFITIFVYGLFLLAIRHKPRLSRWTIFGAVVIAMNNAMFVVANKMTAAANVVVLQFTAPVFIILISFFVFHKKPTKLDIISSVIVFAGIICFFVDGIGGGNLVGDLLAMSCGFVYAIVFMLNEIPEGDPLSSVFWSSFVGVLIGVPSLVQGMPELSTTSLVMLVLMGVVQTGAAYLFLMVGMKYVSPITGILTSAIQPILSPVLVAIFYKEVITPLSIAGAVIVVGSIVIYNLLKEKVQKSEQMQQELDAK